MVLILSVRYFDHNATHPLSVAAREAWLDAVDRFPANPSSPHRWGARSGKALDDARERLAVILGCRASDVVWTSGATESNNAILAHFGAETDGPVLISPMEHPSIRRSAERWLAGRCRSIPVNRDGVVEADWMAKALERERHAAVVVMAANNETGVLQPWRELHRVCEHSGTRLVCDAAQWVGRLPAMGMGDRAWATGCGHKFGGPQGVGFMICPGPFRPMWVGGAQEEGRRAGTENVAGILSMVAALEQRENQLRDENVVEQRVRVRDRFVSGLKTALPEVEIVGERSPRLWNTVAALMPPATDCRRRWVVKLDKLGWAVSTGSACASGKEAPSHVLQGMGYPPESSDRMLRFSAGWETSELDWLDLLEAVGQAAEALTGGVRTGGRDPAESCGPVR